MYMPLRKPGSARKSHRKSRTGCLTCKGRRIKCDEAHPKCLNCLQRGVYCIYSASVSQSRGGRPRKYKEGSHLPQNSLDGDVQEKIPSPLLGDGFLSFSRVESASVSTSDLPQFKTAEMSLMHHYTAHTCTTMACRKDIVDIYKQVAPSTAFSDPPLLYSLLALAALHRACLSDDAQAQDHYFEAATSYQNKAIQVFRERVPNITHDNACSLFFFSSFLAVYVMGYESVSKKCNRPADPSGPTFENIYDWLRLVRGIPSILGQGGGLAFDWVMEGPLKPLADFTSVPPSDFTPDQERCWERLGSALADEERVAEDNERQVYAEALLMLRDYVGVVMGGAGDGGDSQVEVIGLTLVWPAIVSERYIGYLKLRRPGALVLLAQYAVLMNGLGELWWANGWGKALLQFIYGSVPEEWKQLMEDVDCKPR